MTYIYHNLKEKKKEKKKLVSLWQIFFMFSCFHFSKFYSLFPLRERNETISNQPFKIYFSFFFFK